MASDNKVQFLITAKDDASPVLKWVSTNIDTLSTKTKESSKSMSDRAKQNADAFRSLAVWWSIGVAAFWWTSLMLADSAAKSESVWIAYDRMTESVWISWSTLLTELEKSSKWTIQQKDLMISANKAIALWVVKNSEDMTTLMEIARVKGQAMGIDVTQAFGDIVTWLWRWSPMILDNLWIVVKLGETYENYAKSVGKTVEELSAQELKQALINQVVAQWKEELATFWEVATTNAEKLAWRGKQIADAKVSLWTALLPVVVEATEMLSWLVQKVSQFAEENPKLFSTIMIVWTAISWLAVIVWTLWLVLPSIIAGAAAIWTGLAALMWPIWLLVLAIAGLTYLLINNRDEIKAATIILRESLKNTFDEMRKWLKERGENVEKNFSDLRNSIKTMFNDTREAIKLILSDAISLIITFISSSRDAISGAFSNMIWWIAGVAKSILNGAIWIIEWFVNRAVDGLNSLIALANAVPGVSISSIKYVSFWRLAKWWFAGEWFFWSAWWMVSGPHWIDQVPTMLTAGELVLNRAQQSNLANQLNWWSEGKKVEIVISWNNFYGNDRDFMHKIAEWIIEEFKLHTGFASF